MSRDRGCGCLVFLAVAIALAGAAAIGFFAGLAYMIGSMG